ncbi:MAG: glycosyltransferase family 4 protein [Oscillochloridaceae bacterium umkhey_bin13]
MRILVLSTWWPEPADNGSRLRSMQLLRALSTRHEVHLVAFSQGPVAQLQRTELDQICASAVAIERPGRPLRFRDRLQSLMVAEPASVRATWSAEFAATVQASTERLNPTVVLALEIDVAPYARQLTSAIRILEDLELAYLFEHYQQYREPHLRLRYWLTALQHRRYVAALLRDFAAVTVVSAREAALVRDLVGQQSLELAVIPNGADVAASAGYRYQPDLDTLIYPGALSYAANLDAMRYFVAEILPLIRRERPQTRLRITGRTTPEQRAALSNLEGVEFTGYVEDVRALIARSTVEVVPLRQGGGTRLKILEALALGTPVVSTSKGVEGLELQAGQELLVADQPAAFAAATLHLLNDSDVRTQLSEAGRQAVGARYDWAVLTPRLLELLETVVEMRTPAYVAA